MSLDGLLPHIFRRVNEKYGTPQRGLLIICLTAFVASAVGTLTDLINSSVFLLAFTYVSTCYATIRLEEKFRKENPGFKGGRIVPILGMAFSLLLISQVRLRQIVTSLALLSLGAPIYVFFSPKKELTELKTAFLSRRNVLKRTYEQGERFLAHPVRHLKWAVYRLTNRMRAWRTQSV